MFESVNMKQININLFLNSGFQFCPQTGAISECYFAPCRSQNNSKIPISVELLSETLPEPKNLWDRGHFSPFSVSDFWHFFHSPVFRVQEILKESKETHMRPFRDPVFWVRVSQFRLILIRIVTHASCFSSP